MFRIAPTIVATLALAAGGIAYGSLGNPDRQRMEISADPMCQSIEQTVTPAECERLKFAAWVFDIEYSPRVTGGWRDPETTGEWLTEEASKPLDLAAVARAPRYKWPEAVENVYLSSFEWSGFSVIDQGRVPEQSKLGDVFGTKTPQDEPIIQIPGQDGCPAGINCRRAQNEPQGRPPMRYSGVPATYTPDALDVVWAPFKMFASFFIGPLRRGE